MSLTKKTSQLIVAFLALAILALVTVSGLYIFHVGRASGYSLSAATTDWAQFGDYLAGTLGPLFSLLAFGGVLCTVWLQASQLESAQRQSSLEEVQRAMATVSGQIDQILAETVSHQFNSVTLRSSPATFFRVLSSAGTGALSLPCPDYMRQALTQQFVEEAQSALNNQAQVAGVELDQLCWLLGRYRAQQGSGEVLEFYRRRYGAIVCWLDALGFLSGHPEVHREFDVPGLREAMRLPRSG
jgi:hypothetical protein